MNKILCTALLAIGGCMFSGHAGVGSGGGTGGGTGGGGGGGYGGDGGDGGGGGDGGSRGDGFVVPGQWSLAERQYWQKLIGEQNDYLKILNDDCGTHITASFAWESFRPHWKTDQDGWGVDAYDRAHAVTPLTAVRNVCVKGGMEKSAVQAAISSIVIEYGTGSATGTPHLDVANGVFHAVIEPASNAAGSWEEDVEVFVEQNI